MKKDGLALALERAAQIMSGSVTYVGYERQLARALIELWQQRSGDESKAAARYLFLRDKAYAGDVETWWWSYLGPWPEDRGSPETFDRLIDVEMAKADEKA